MDDEVKNSAIENIKFKEIKKTSKKGTPVDVCGSQLAPLGTSAPVQDDVFTSDEAVSFNPVNSDITINLMEEEVRTNDGVPITNDKEFATPTTGPTPFTHPPTEGPEIDDLLRFLKLKPPVEEKRGTF